MNCLRISCHFTEQTEHIYKKDLVCNTPIIFSFFPFLFIGVPSIEVFFKSLNELVFSIGGVCGGEYWVHMLLKRFKTGLLRYFPMDI